MAPGLYSGCLPRAQEEPPNDTIQEPEATGRRYRSAPSHVSYRSAAAPGSVELVACCLFNLWLPLSLLPTE